MTLPIYYVYKYTRDNGEPFYIGMGHGTRINDSHPGYKLPKKSNRIFIEMDMLESDTLLLERKLTEQFGLIIDGTGILENKIHGGHASPRGMTGKTHSETARLNISVGNKGKIRTQEHKENYSKPKSAEHIEKNRQANIGRPDDGRYTKISATKKNKPWTQARRDAQTKKAL